MTTLLLTIVGLALLLAILSCIGAHITLNGDRRVPLTVLPEQFGLPHEDIEFKNVDGLKLKSWFIPADPPSNRTIILCHGWGANKGEILEETYFLRARGYNLLYFDFRSCGESEGDILTVGYLEAKDFDAAISYLKSRRPGDSIGVYGLSMGAMVSFCGLTRHPGIKAAVLESIFPSHDEACYRYAKFKRGAPFSFTYFMLIWIRWRLGADPELTSPVKLASLVKDTPILAICGEQDIIATPEMSRSLINQVQVPKEFWVVPGAGHAKCAVTAGEAYVRKLSDFYAKYL